MISLPEATYYFSATSYIFVLIAGTIGNILNLFVFFTRDFRKQASVFYLIISSIVNLLYIDVGLILRFSTEYFGNNSINTNVYVCKIRNYLLICIPMICSACIFLSSFDRCISTSTNIRWRRLSTISFAQRISSTTILIIMISGSFVLVVYGIFNEKCTASSGIGATLVNIYVVTYVFVIAIGGTCLCGILTWIHLKQARVRVEAMPAATIGIISNTQRMDKQLIVLIFIQGLVCTIINIIRISGFVYDITTGTILNKSVERRQIEYLIQQTTLVIFYAYFGLSFYLNYLVSSAFRKACHENMRNLLNICRFV